VKLGRVSHSHLRGANGMVAWSHHLVPPHQCAHIDFIMIGDAELYSGVGCLV